VHRFVARGALVVALLAPAACGSAGTSSSPQKASGFKTSFNSVVTHFKQTSKAIGNEINHAPTQTNGQIATHFKHLAGRWQGSLSRLETLKAPADVATKLNTLTGAATRTESDLNAIVAAARADSASAAKQASATLVTDILSAKTASQQISNALRGS